MQTPSLEDDPVNISVCADALEYPSFAGHLFFPAGSVIVTQRSLGLFVPFQNPGAQIVQYPSLFTDPVRPVWLVAEGESNPYPGLHEETDIVRQSSCPAEGWYFPGTQSLHSGE